MKKIVTIVLVLVFAISASMLASAAISCTIKDATSCTGNEKNVLKLSDLNDGGSHAGLPSEPNFLKAVCCSGVPSLQATKEDIGATYTEGMLSMTVDGHVSQTKIEGYTQLNLTSSTQMYCSYISSGECSPRYETCLFSISGDEDAHISSCDPADGVVYDSKYCCSTGASVCTIEDIVWGVADDEGNFEELAGDEPLGPVGKDMPVYMAAVTSGCEEGTLAEFIIYYNDDDTPANKSQSLKDIPLGTFRSTEDLEMDNPNAVVTVWWNAAIPVGEDQMDYYFKVRLRKSTAPPTDVTSDKSDVLKVMDDCGSTPILEYSPLDRPSLDFWEDTCGISVMPEECDCAIGAPGCKYRQDANCDRVDDCLEDYVSTVADPSTVDPCLGAAAGTAGCFPAMDCTMLEWSTCKNCEAGQPCADAGFSPGDQYMERCETEGEAGCNCAWIGERPMGCTDDVLNQWNSRFKACIEEEEFPVFTGWNVIAVLLVLSMYYGIVILRKRR